MGGKGKKSDDEDAEQCADDCSDDCCGDHDQVDVEEQVQQKIKALPSLKEKVQAIAVNFYLIEKRRIVEELQKEIDNVERNFRQSFKPFVDEISSIVQGKHIYSAVDFEDIGDLLTEQEHSTKHNYFTQEKIPEFWLKVMLNNESLGEHIEEIDEPLLKHLQKIEAGKSEDLNKLWVTFYFSENEWFTNTKLTKIFESVGEVTKKSSGDQILWKEGKNITVKIVKKKNKKKGGEKKTKQVKEKSFFNFFLDIEIDSDEEQNQNQKENEDAETLLQQYEIAYSIFEEIIPKSLELYLGLVERMEDQEDLEAIEDDDEENEDGKKGKGK